MTFSQRRFRQHRVGFVSPKCGLGSFRQNLPLSPVRAQVARVIANNRPDTMERSRRPFLAAAGWFFPVASSAKTPLASFRQNAPRPHAEEHRSAKQVGCFPSSAALRCVSKHEGHAAAVFILRDARALVRLCGSACACALLRMRTSSACCTVHHVKQPISFPRRVFCARGLQPCLAHPNRGWAERRESFGCSAEHP